MGLLAGPGWSRLPRALPASPSRAAGGIATPLERLGWPCRLPRPTPLGGAARRAAPQPGRDGRLGRLHNLDRQHRAGLWVLFYTGGHRAERGLVQRIGLATSQDLVHWEKHAANPLIVADPRWYEQLDLDVWHDQAWRDPWVFRHPQMGDFHAFITARVNHGPPDGRGVIAHARSSDLVEWEVLPPATEPGEFGHMEVPQLVGIRGRYYLIFCATASVHSAARRERTALQSVTGTHYLVAESPLGPFHYASDEFMVGDAVGSFYAGKLAQDPDGAWVFLASRQFTPDGTFMGELSDPMPMNVDSAGNLSVDWREYL